MSSSRTAWIIAALLGIGASVAVTLEACREPQVTPHTATVMPAAPSPDAATAPADTSTSDYRDDLSPPDGALTAAIRHVKPNHETATGELFTNVSVSWAEGRWWLIGCEASVAGSCRASKHYMLEERDVAELDVLLRGLRALPQSPTPDACYHLEGRAEPHPPGGYTLSHKKVSYAGSMTVDASPCPPAQIARWLVAHFTN